MRCIALFCFINAVWMIRVRGRHDVYRVGFEGALPNEVVVPNAFSAT